MSGSRSSSSLAEVDVACGVGVKLCLAGDFDCGPQATAQRSGECDSQSQTPTAVDWEFAGGTLGT